MSSPVFSRALLGRAYDITLAANTYFTHESQVEAYKAREGSMTTLLSHPKINLEQIQLLDQNYGIDAELPCLFHKLVTNPKHNLHSL